MRLTIRRAQSLLVPLVSATAVAALGAAVVVSGPAAPSSETTSPRLVSKAHHTNAGAIFKWGHSHWDDEFTEPSGHVRGTWHLNRPHQVALQHGQLTLNAGQHGSVVVTAKDQAAKTGRWEARVRSRQYTRGTPYQVNWELVPVRDKAQHCGAQSIQMASYNPGDRTVHGAVHSLPDHTFGFHKRLNLGRDVYHTYAVEVTRTSVSWFVDTHVIRTERRPEALSGVTLRPQFRLQAVKGHRMAASRMQMDWVRYYTMQRPDRRSIAAPHMHKSVNHQAC